MTPPSDISTRLRHWALGKPDQAALIFLGDGETETQRLSYGALYDGAARVARRLSACGAGGRPVLLLYPPGLEFVTALFGCFHAGAAAAPLPFQARNQSYERIRLIIADAAPAVVLTLAASLETARAMAAGVPCLATDADLDDPAPPAPSTAGDPAVLQYTSGATGAPKGVVVSRGAVTANLEMIRRNFEIDEATRYVSWLPVFHDMGLFGCVLEPVYCGATCVLMPPLAFLQKPQRWLQAVSRYRATLSGGPNFAFDHCNRRFERMALDGVDLSTWEIAFCGAERVRLRTMQTFARLFQPFGFRATSLFPCYGMAETTLLVSGGPKGGGVRTAEAPGASAAPVVSCGALAPGQTVAIVDPHTRSPAPAGEIWISGDHVASGYWNDPHKSAETFHASLSDGSGRFLRTGDIGFVHDGDLYVTGRLREMLIVRGANISPDDVELTVATSVKGFAGVSAAFSIDVDELERIVVVQEVERDQLRTLDPASAISEALAAVAEQHGFRLYDLVLAYPGAIPRTTSGKVQRRRCREAYLAGTLRAMSQPDGHRSLGRYQPPSDARTGPPPQGDGPRASPSAHPGARRDPGHEA